MMQSSSSASELEVQTEVPPTSLSLSEEGSAAAVRSSSVKRETHSAASRRTQNSTVLKGVVRPGRRTKELTQSLAPGSIAVLDHPDLDAVAARALRACRPLAVVNIQPFVTGRYPNRGPALLLEAGIPLFEAIPGGSDNESSLFERLTDEETVLLDTSNGLLQNARGQTLAPLQALTLERLNDRLAAARANLDTELSHFAENTLRYLARDDERALLLDPVAVPDVKARIAGCAVLVVVRGESYEDDLRQIAPFIREQKPVVIAVDGAADTLLAEGIRPDIILGDMDSIRDSTLRCGAQLIVHAYVRTSSADSEQTPAAPGMARIEKLGLSAQTFPVRGTSEDAALLLAYEKGADLIVAVGTHSNLEDFLDKGRAGMASTFLVRLKVGSRLMDARGVSRLYTGRAPMAPLLAFLGVSALFPVFVLLASTPQGQIAWRSIVVWFRLLFR